ncbi:MAG: helix-turn-helix domain-containing protein [Saprospiraceae bacterium]|nr:helix-turn-helix domain-containing protein [Saprospiraceae bacterium]MBK6566476.1 helix-turn-helix domain-containing protein [Saprospiraceae bacterium]MBK8549209.1 helix-turn-helix domain-containing protein [Saprospiraceae bacterium]MBK8855384.1 helix-turn-helix domain-containing protein [Saprospiraceae bacterium]MBK9043752.1 helix-turn-helix domain-containing protein [Saprospiraceae bacterium]
MLNHNIKYLRQKHSLSQQELSEKLSIPRSSLSDYERGHTQVGLDVLIKLSEIFDIRIDDLLKTNVSHQQYEIARDHTLKVLAITVDTADRNLIDLVETKAAAGYLTSFTDPEYIKDLPKINFPNIPIGTYRGFEIQGDSMLPMESGTIVICHYLENIFDVKKNKTYVIISKGEGVVYKRVQPDFDNKRLLLFSDNDQYLPYDITFEEIEEIWQYYAHIGFNDVKKSFNYMLEEKLNSMQYTLNEVYKTIVSK